MLWFLYNTVHGAAMRLERLAAKIMPYAVRARRPLKESDKP